MNDKDKEAFENWWRENKIPENIFDYVVKSWQAACEYKEKEQYIEGSIHESGGVKREMTWKESSDMFERMYMNSLAQLKKEHERIREFQAENKKLREALEFYADYQNWKFSDKYACIIWMDHDNYPSHINGRKINGYESLFVSGKIAREALKEVGEK